MRFILTICLFLWLGCSAEKSVNSEQEKEEPAVQILKVKNLSFKNFSVEQQVGPNGGTIMLGDDSSGYCRLDFPAGALDTTYTIHFDWQIDGFMEAYFGPHGLQFNQGVYVRLSYMDADLTGVNQDSLRIYYYKNNNKYELVPGSNVNTDSLYVYGYLEHFSRYAIGCEK